MSLLAADRIARRFGERVVFRDVSLRLARGDRVGVVGPNGCGKSTLLRILAGSEEPDEGRVRLARDARAALLEQELPASDATVDDHVAMARARHDAVEAELRALEPRLALEADALERYGALAAAYEQAGGYAFDSQAVRVLSGLGLGAIERTRALATLSGGERTRLGLARLLLEDADVLLLDEPTNHLDVAALEWLEGFLVEGGRTVVVASHDRYFLDRVATRTLAFADGTARSYRGGYGSYARQRAAEVERRSRTYERQRAEIARQEDFIARERSGQRARQARGRRKQLARTARVEAPATAPAPSWRLPALPLGSQITLETTPLVVGWSRARPLLRSGALRVERGARVAIVGPNGSGKTTLLRTLLGEVPALDGFVRSAPGARVAAFAQAQPETALAGGVLDAFREASGWAEQESRDLLARFLFRGEAVFRDVATLSGGELARLALARLAARPANLLALDEPTNHLDLPGREALDEVLAGYEGAIVLISHDRYLVDRLATHVWLVRDGGVRTFEGNYSVMRAALEREERAAASAPAPARRKRPALRSRRSPPPAQRLDELEARIGEVERRLEQLALRVAEVAQAGNYMEARRVGAEYAELERALHELYVEAARGE